MKEEERNKKLKTARTIADYQFGRGAGETLFPDTDTLEFMLSKTRRISQIKDNLLGTRIATLRSADGLLTLSIEGAKRLHRFFEYPGIRVVMNEESSEFIKDGAFCKHLIDADPAIRAYDEVILVDEHDNLLATGKAMLSGEEMKKFEHGVAVKVRYGASQG
jgi:uncharacterized protein with predicted RNA binding PUA domain